MRKLMLVNEILKLIIWAPNTEFGANSNEFMQKDY